MRFVITIHTSEPPEKFTQLIKTLRREFKKCPMAGCAIVAVTHCEDSIYAFSGKQIIHLRRTQALPGVSAIVCQHGQPDLPNWVTDWKLKGKKAQPKMYDIVWWYDLIHGIVGPGLCERVRVLPSLVAEVEVTESENKLNRASRERSSPGKIYTRKIRRYDITNQISRKPTLDALK